MKNQTERIMHGASFSGIISTIGSIMCFASVLMFFLSIHFIIPLIILIFGLIFTLSIELVEIDYGQRKIRKVLYLVFYKHGEWMPLDNFDKLILGADHASFRIAMPGSPLFQKDINLRSYDIYIVNKIDPAKTFLLLSCNNIPLAQEKLEEYSLKFNIEMTDTIKQGWERAKARKRR